ncbi:MAG TPA: tRNA (adenosine(37)-N6)-threonylcarbamoyltransferase complex transferase subunit TsaD [bacterium]|nr:tRNA (adenosine(37)-N6)-threonylcarbamoyltransferase complex transferase subunit TsaD [bacterium]HPN44869.1 tRNA (adenosine(37)-N6)-threonylcarbamoyltransferase complex transferase subunit TsaD [bacterium]
MNILGIETSCDETSAAVVNEQSILANIIATQSIHQKYGGVVPEYASRAHIIKLAPIVQEALHTAGMDFRDLDGLAVTFGPGLAGSLLAGLCFCKGLALSLNIPWIGINHIEGHIVAVHANQQNIDYPAICLVASGGHTILVYIKEPLHYRILGRTIDDAAGEAFDKVAKILGLPYPGGPSVEKFAQTGNEAAIRFPRALLENDNYNFSFSGLKTAVLYYVESLHKQGIEAPMADICASFQKAVIDVLAQKSFNAVKEYRCKSLILAGGVVRNTPLRENFRELARHSQVHFYAPAPDLCTDNAAMIARAGYMRLIQNQRSDFMLDVVPNLSFTDSPN